MCILKTVDGDGEMGVGRLYRGTVVRPGYSKRDITVDILLFFNLRSLRSAVASYKCQTWTLKLLGPRSMAYMRIRPTGL